MKIQGSKCLMEGLYMFHLSKFGFFKATEKPKAIADVKSAQSSQTVWVHVWDTTVNSVGHASIQVGGNKPKMSEEDPGNYIGFWPGVFPSFGPFAIIPGPAVISNVLSADMVQEGGNGPSNFGGDFGPQSGTYKVARPLPPSRSIKIEGLDTDAMLIEMKKQEAAINDGSTTYQLYPKFTPFDDILANGAAMIGQDPIDCFLSLKNPNPTASRYNCTTFTAHILNAGGMKIDMLPFRPWGITPTQLGEKIEEKIEEKATFKP